MKRRRFATLRFALFGLENLNDFRPLQQLLHAKISPERLAAGRPVRVGVVSFWDGGYREILPRSQASEPGENKFLEYVYASSVPPLYGKLPRIVDGPEDDPTQWPQFTDGGMRHVTPVVSYLKHCARRSGAETEGAGTDGNRNQECSWNFVAPPHEPVQQLFVIVTSPYTRSSDHLTVTNPEVLPPRNATNYGRTQDPGAHTGAAG